MATKTGLTLILASYVAYCQGSFSMQFGDGTTDMLVNTGDEVILRCNVINENPRVSFEWYRRGADDTKEIIGVVRIMTNDYLKSRTGGHFSINQEFNVSSDGADAIYTMTISKAMAEDNARYGCGTTDRFSGQLATLRVSLSPETIHLYSSKRPLSSADLDCAGSNDCPRAYGNNELVTVDVNAHGYFMCVADGFIPEPTLRMTYNGEALGNIRHEPTKTHVVTSETRPSFKYHVFRAVAVTEGQLKMEVGASRRPLKCTATVETTGATVETGIRPVLKMSPKIVCSNTTAPVGSVNQKLSCILEADPPADEVFWRWEEPDGTTRLGPDDSVHTAYSSRNILQDGRWELSLIFPAVSQQMFKPYRLYARNELGNNNNTAWLVRETMGSSGSGASVNCIVISTSVLATALLRVI